MSYFDKFRGIESLTNKTTFGNTDYLTFIQNTTSLPMIVLYTPLKIVYFYFSPMIWDCYSLGIFFVFLFSSTIYMFLICNIFKGKNNVDKNLFILLFIGIILLSIVHGWGTGNAGTAMRHREKMLPLLIILYSMVYSRRGKIKK